MLLTLARASIITSLRYLTSTTIKLEEEGAKNSPISAATTKETYLSAAVILKKPVISSLSLASFSLKAVSFLLASLKASKHKSISSYKVYLYLIISTIINSAGDKLL
ncbi:hypothetical protein HBI74_058420 [Parastagonospora nodorum]|nr:hypothetical protein HBI74_058420 [Parastagonospora nodorum]